MGPRQYRQEFHHAWGFVRLEALERELEPKVLPALRRLKLEIEKLIGKLEQRAR